MDRDRAGSRDTVLLGAMWRYRWLMLVIVVATIAASAAVGLSSPVAYTASSSLVIDDPRQTSVFGSVAFVSPTRYLADQVAILQSSAVALRAADLAAAEGFDELDGVAFVEKARIEATPDSNFIEISFWAEESDAAIFGANALADAYQDVRRSESIRSAASALEQMDRKISAINGDLLDLQSRVDELASAGPIGSNLGAQYTAVLDRLGSIYASSDGGALTEEERQELTDLADQLAIIQRVETLEGESTELGVLLQEQAVAIDRRSVLQLRRDQIEIDAELESGSVSLFSPALGAVETGPGLQLSVSIGLFLGALIAAGVAYVLANRRQVFAGRLEPEAQLNAPLLAEIPNFQEEGLSSELPVRDAPLSASAEAFRFAIAGIEIQASGRTGDESATTGGRVRSLAVISSKVGDGKTTVAANLALASARRGSRVLVIDADFGDQRLSSLLLPYPSKRTGITDIVESGSQLRAAVETVELAPGVLVDLLGRGTVTISAPDFFRSAGAREFFRAVSDEYDLVLVDTPPLLQAAYSSLVAQYVDRIVAVVGHGSSRMLLQDVSDRLLLVGTPVAGYVYNRAPLRKEFIGTEGSMKDVLGSG